MLVSGRVSINGESYSTPPPGGISSDWQCVFFVRWLGDSGPLINEAGWKGRGFYCHMYIQYKIICIINVLNIYLYNYTLASKVFFNSDILKIDSNPKNKTQFLRGFRKSQGEVFREPRKIFWIIKHHNHLGSTPCISGAYFLKHGFPMFSPCPFCHPCTSFVDNHEALLPRSRLSLWRWSIEK